MPIDPLRISQQPDYSQLQKFGNMAVQGAGRIVIDEGDRHGQSLVVGKQPTGWGRLVAWLKGPSAEERIENKAALALFRQSLEAAHGEYVAKVALRRSGIDSSKGVNLSASKVIEVLSNAQGMEKDLRLGNSYRVNRYLDTLFKHPDISRLDAPDRRSLRQAITDAIKTDPSFSQRSLTDDDMNHPASIGMDNFKSLTGYLRGATDSLSEKNVAHARGLWFKAAADVLNDGANRRETAGDHPGAGRLRELRNELTKQSVKEVSSATNRHAQNLGKSLKDLPTELETTLKVVFKERGLSVDGMKDQLHHAHIKALNQGQNWETVDKTVSFTLNGKAHDFGSTIRPASQMGGIFPHPYLPGSGVCSATTDSADHAVNLAASELRSSNNKVLFSGVRHGVNSAFGLHEGDRLSANACRTEECVTAALASRPGVLKQALANPLQPVRLELSSISLLTPDYFRTHIQHSENSSEKTQMEEQIAAWVSLKPVPGEDFIRHTVMDPDTGKPQIIRIKLDVLPFNFGVNEGAVEGKFGMSSERDLVSGWGFARATNEASLSKLFGQLDTHGVLGGKVGEFLARHDVSQQDKETVKALSNQIRNMWANGSHMHGGNDPYKMVARLAVLTHKIDGVPLWNCKSGKDRTGMLDVEAKFLAARIELTGEVPKPDTELTEQEKQMYRIFIQDTGNLEIQRYNTGLGGFKTEGVQGIDARIGDDRARELHRGGSKYVKE